MTISNHCMRCSLEFKAKESYVVQLSCGHLFHLPCLILYPNCYVCPECNLEYISIPMAITFDFEPPCCAQDPKVNLNILNKLIEILEAAEKKDETIIMLEAEMERSHRILPRIKD